jgi:regulator of protease activity HflC (stomatin/prohibitin superfamily)
MGNFIFFISGLLAVLFFLLGFFINQPEQSRVITLLGKYKYTDPHAGLRWAPPWYFPHFKVSPRLRNFETEKSKVNDANGNPIEISVIVVWRVSDAAKATFSVDDFVTFVHRQSESAVRNLATRFPYDYSMKETEHGLTLRANPEEISELLQNEIALRVAEVGVEIVEARINHLAYAVEIASAMSNGNKQLQFWMPVKPLFRGLF